MQIFFTEKAKGIFHYGDYIKYVYACLTLWYCKQNSSDQSSFSFVRVYCYDYNYINNKLVRPRWPYDMRPSVRAAKYMCVIVIR